jgi:hypothetical protein
LARFLTYWREKRSVAKRTKGWSRAKKEALIRGEFERLPELSKRHRPPAKKGAR